MTDDELRNLAPGDMVRSMSDPSHTYIVTANFGDRVTAVRSADLRLPAEEWAIVHKAGTTQVVYSAGPTAYTYTSVYPPGYAWPQR